MLMLFEFKKTRLHLDCQDRGAESIKFIRRPLCVVASYVGAGRKLRRGLEWWSRKVEEQGGLKTQNGDRLQLELIFKDTQMNNSVAIEKADELFYALTDPVQVMVNTHFEQNLVVNQAMKEEQINKVMLHCTGGKGQRGF